MKFFLINIILYQNYKLFYYKTHNFISTLNIKVELNPNFVIVPYVWNKDKC